MNESFEAMLTGGHPNSLGRTVEVVDLVLAERDRLAELRSRLRPQLQRLTSDPRRSVASNARKVLSQVDR